MTTNKIHETIHELQHAAKSYRIITSDEEFIWQTGEQIVAACKLNINAKVWGQNFLLMAEHVRHWSATRKEKIALTLVELRSNKVVFWIAPVADSYDFDLGFEMADLDVFLNRSGGIGYCETRQVPHWELATFVSEATRLVWPADVTTRV